VIAVEQQAHGHTADVDRPLTYSQMAEDTADLLRQLKLKTIDLFGYSMGAGIALEMAVRHPNLVRKVALASPAYSKEGFHPELLKAIGSTKPEDLAGSVFEAAYAKTAPDIGTGRRWSPSATSSTRSLWAGRPPRSSRSPRRYC
jgi:pimeloyl-ACP methyl ester carboxylesterase